MKKCISYLLSTTCLLLFLCPTALALGEISNYSTILLEMGIPSEIIEAIPMTDARDLVESYLKDHDSVAVSTTTLEVDVLSEMHEFVCQNDTELLSNGYTEAQIDDRRSIINLYNSLSDEELIKEGLSLAEVASLRTALDPLADNNQILRSPISSSKLTLTQTVTDYSASTPCYFIGVYFNWSSPYIWDLDSDKVVISWGGGLTQAKSYQNVSYYKTNAVYTQFTDYVGVTIPVYTERAIDAMGIYTFPQSNSRLSHDEFGIVKTGSIRYQISQSKAEGKTTKVIVYYAHQIAALTGSIQFTGSGLIPAVSIGVGYDTAYAENTIKV